MYSLITVKSNRKEWQKNLELLGNHTPTGKKGSKIKSKEKLLKKYMELNENGK